MVALLRRAIDSQPDLQVVGVADNGRAAVELARRLRPDIITMDVEMPRMDGLAAIREIMSTDPIPIVVISAHATGAEAQQGIIAMNEGAVAVLAKPENVLGDGLDGYARNLARTLRTYSEVRLVRRRRRSAPVVADTPASGAASRTRTVTGGVCEVVALGVSTGGPETIKRILESLPASFDVPVAVTIHMAEDFLPGFAGWLDKAVGRPVALAANRESLRRGRVYVAPGGTHLILERRANGELAWRLDNGPPVGGFRPSVTPFLASVAVACGPRAVGGILTGMGRDGADGLLALHQAGGQTFVQDEATSVIFGMPAAALKVGAASLAVPLDRIAGHLGAAARRAGNAPK